MPSAQDSLRNSCDICCKSDLDEYQQLEVGSILIPVSLPPAASASRSLGR